MSTTSAAELERQWQERVRKGTFSQGVLSVGQIRVMGRSGDAVVQFPRISSLEALGTLAPDEAYAVRAAQRIIEQAREQDRSVFAASPGQAPQRVTEFSPDAESLVIVARIAGG